MTDVDSPSARRIPGALLAIAVVVVLALATLLLPWPVARAIDGTSWAGPSELTRAVGDGLVSDWSQGVREPGHGESALATATHFWMVFHIVKALLAAGLVLASSWLLAIAWQARRVSRGRVARLALLLASGAASAVVLLATVIVIANIQGAFAPLASLLSFLTSGEVTPALAQTAQSLGTDLAGSLPSATAATIAHDFSTYHAVVAILLGATTLVAGAMAVRLIRHHEWLAGGALTAVGLAFVVLTAANVGTALNPTPALSSFLATVAS
ncbi:MAG: hypothetical protein ACR2KE_05635 [Candidatus Nanopelagicales bacterium]